MIRWIARELQGDGHSYPGHLAAAVLTLLLCCHALVAKAADTRTVATDAEVEIANAEKKLFKPEPKVEPSGAGTLRVDVQGTGNSETRRLMYRAPLRTIDGVAKVTYTIEGDQPSTVEINVAELAISKSLQVLPGSQVVVDSGFKEGDVTGQRATFGNVSLREEKATPKTFGLVYVPPAGKDNDVADVIYYKRDGDNKAVPTRVQIEISSNPWGDGYGAAGKVMFAMFVSAAVLEVALATIFGTAWYRRIPGSRGLRTVITAIVAFALVHFAELDVVTQLISILKNKTYAPWWLTKVLSALILAGGSAGVNALMVSLKLRAPHPIADAVRPPPDRAWIAVKVVTTTSDTRHMDILTRLATEPKDTASEPGDQVIGTLTLGRERSLIEKIFRGDSNRFPSWGGFAVLPSTDNRYIVLRMPPDVQAAPAVVPAAAAAAAAAAVAPAAASLPKIAAFGPYAFAPGAIIDVSIKV